MKAFAADCGLPYGTINSMMNGHIPGAEKVVQIASAANVSIDWLLTGIKPSQEIALQNNDMVYVPHYDVRASAGHGQLVESEEVTGEVAFKRDWLRRFVINVDRVGVIEAAGDSMRSASGDGINDGDLLLVDNSVQSFMRNGVYVLEINGYLMVKRLELLINGGLRVMSDNPAYKDQEVGPNDVMSLRILGFVFWHGHALP